MLENLIVSSLILSPLFFGILGVLFAERSSLQRVLSLLGSILHLALSFQVFLMTFTSMNSSMAGFLVVKVGGWLPPAGITLVVDGVASILILISSLLALMINIFQQNSYHRHILKGTYHGLFHFMLMGVCGAFMTGDLFNLYVFFEIFLITSFVMAIYRGHSSQLLGGYKYLILNLVASSGFIIALGCIYNSLGTLNVAHIARLIASGEANLITEVGLVFLVTTFAAKSGLVPLYYWLPASYPSLPTPILALFAGLLTKIGVYTLLRCYSLFLPNYVWLQETILIISLLTMSIGVIGAAVQMNIRKILSFHIISQIGYITIGIGLSSFVGYLATIVYLIHHMVVKTNLFLVAGMIQKLKGTNELVNLGSLKKNYPILALLFMIPALSLAGVPPLSGFWAKWMVIQSLTVSNHWISLIVAMLVSAFTLFSMMKIWLEAFWKTENLSLEKTGLETKIQTNKSDFFVMAIPVFILCIWTLAFGFGIESVIKLSKQAATQLAAPQNYITAVLGEQGGVE